MSEQPRDWDRELAKIDRVIAQQGNAAPTGSPAPLPGGRVPAPGAPIRRRSVALTWFWVGLALALAVALLIWPYQRGCGLQLMFFLGAAGVTGVIAVLGALASWSHRRGFAHVVSLLVLLWAGAAVVREVLPRVGYARTNLTWMCASVPAAPAPSSPAPQLPTPGKPAPQTTAP